MPDLIDLTGKRFGKLTVIRRDGTWRSEDGFNRKPIWLCRCDCGNEKRIIGDHLKSGATKSCGCIKKGRKRKNANQT